MRSKSKIGKEAKIRLPMEKQPPAPPYPPTAYSQPDFTNAFLGPASTPFSNVGLPGSSFHSLSDQFIQQALDSTLLTASSTTGQEVTDEMLTNAPIPYETMFAGSAFYDRGPDQLAHLLQTAGVVPGITSSQSVAFQAEMTPQVFQITPQKVDGSRMQSWANAGEIVGGSAQKLPIPRLPSARQQVIPQPPQPVEWMASTIKCIPTPGCPYPVEPPISTTTVEESLPEPEATATGSSEDSGCDTDPSRARDLRFNITWDSSDIARLCGTNITFLLRDGVLELATPIVPRLRRRRQEDTGSSEEEDCEVCDCANPTMDDFYRWRFNAACSPECLMWTNPYNFGEHASGNVIKLRQSRKKRNSKVMKTTEARKTPPRLFTWPDYAADVQCSLADVRAFQSPSDMLFLTNLLNKVRSFADIPGAAVISINQDREKYFHPHGPGDLPSYLIVRKPTTQNNIELSESMMPRISRTHEEFQTVNESDNPTSAALDPQLFGQNPFEVGMWLEAIDPVHPHLYCLMEVTEVKAFRLRLHFTGYPDIHDIWVNHDSHFVFPPGWCGHNGKKLAPPKNVDGSDINEKDWKGMREELADLYFDMKKVFKNAVDLKAEQSVFVGGHGFRIGQKLEAVDKTHPGMICVATVKDILFSRILIHFDGWANEYDYWTEPWSSLIYEAGYCEKNNISISVPKGYNPAKFTWTRYLEETGSQPVPGSCFVKRIPPKEPFQVGDRLEAVDPYCPRNIRVATVLAIEEHRLRLRFDGWVTDMCDFTEDMDSPNIFPPRFCELSHHPLILPPGYVASAGFQFAEPPRSTLCSVKYSCGGFGHCDPAFAVHNRVADCPYRKPPLAQRIPDRLTGLLPAPVVEEKKVSCTTPDCDGRGHITGKFATHLSAAGCPNVAHPVKTKKPKKTTSSYDDHNHHVPSASVSGSSLGRSSPDGSSREPSHGPGTVLQTSNGARRSHLLWMVEKKKQLEDQKRQAKLHAGGSYKGDGGILRSTGRGKSKYSDVENNDTVLPESSKGFPGRPESFNWSREFFQSRKLRAQISTLAKDIRTRVCRRHDPGQDVADMLRETVLQDYRKPLYDTTGSVDSVTDVIDAFAIDTAKLPDMDCEQAAQMAVKLFGQDSDVVARFRQEEMDGAGLILLNLDGLLKFLKISLGAAVTLDGIIRRARELSNFSVE